jgi:hypothetical protein
LGRSLAVGALPPDGRAQAPAFVFPVCGRGAHRRRRGFRRLKQEALAEKYDFGRFWLRQCRGVETPAELACLLQAIKLLLQVRNQLRAIGPMNSLEKRVLRDGSRTGILQGRSDNPGEPLRAIQSPRPLFGTTLLF